MEESREKAEIELEEAEKIFGIKSELNSKALEVEGGKLWICPQSFGLGKSSISRHVLRRFCGWKERCGPFA